ncbi:uncharacterized protein LOC115631810 [Scaptodrosophila lebanonensis]|uniref:Uncharacterized protein LOC115631810 n=1 Tax=Drosophila lebanonensis TaxID=7225 RepID=A0A6J2UBD6_DROLE|nr:uncharacterized protein LOC115631810 [Scaptodrosophila lebanonensis]
MVHQDRTPSKAIPAKHLSPMRNAGPSGKYAVSSSPTDSFLHSSRLTANSNNNSNSSLNSAAYKYNNMVNNNRDQFNALHFC